MSDPFIGEIKMVAFNYAPAGYAQCLGQTMAVAQNQALFALIGNVYGGTPPTTFALPDFQGRSPVGVGAGFGLTAVTLAQKSGAENTQLTADNLPAFSAQLTGTASVAIPASSTAATSKEPSPTAVLAQTVDTAVGAEVDIYATNADTTLKPFNVTVNGTAVCSGTATPLGIRNPFLGTNFIIALTGLWPTRD